MSEDKQNPLADHRRTKLKLVEAYLGGLEKTMPLEVRMFSDLSNGVADTFDSTLALDHPKDSLVYVALTLKRDLEFHLQYVTTGKYVRDYLKWLAVLKNATRTALHTSDALERQHRELRGFAYGQIAKTGAQRTWCFLQWMVLELTQSIMAIEDCYPELADQFDKERAKYAAEWQKEVAFYIRREQELSALLSSMNQD